MTHNEKTSLARAVFPEEVGVSSRKLAALIEDFYQNDIELHSLMVLRHGKVAYESWASPYGSEIPHTMYSVSKSVTAAAIGFAVEEGLMTLDTRVIDVFPEYAPEEPDENLEALTVYHLLTMTAGKDVSAMSDKTKESWIKIFFEAKWAFAPGEFWRYISENTYMLSAMLQRLSGMTMTEYLTPRLYEPLGFGRVPFWETDGNGVEAGGWGLYLTTEEMAKFTLCYLHNGVFEGRQVIPADWVRESSRKQVDNLQYSEPAASCGYGYCFPRNPIPNSYRADGMFSQFGLVFEDYDACFVMTACALFNRKTRDCLWRHLPGIFTEPSDKKPGKALQKRLQLKALPDLPARERSPLEAEIDNKILKIQRRKIGKELGFPIGMLTLPVVQLNYEKLGNIEEIRFRFRDNECEMTWRERLYKNTIVCGMDGHARNSRIRLSQFVFTANSTASWEDEKTLQVWVRPLETIGQRRLTFVFEEGKVTMLPTSVPDAKSMMDYLAEKVPFFIKEPVAAKAVQAVLSKADRLLEIKQKGKIKK